MNINRELCLASNVTVLNTNTVPVVVFIAIHLAGVQWELVRASTRRHVDLADETQAVLCLFTEMHSSV